MTNNRKIRLIQVAKEFKVGLNTIVDFLLKKGIQIDGSPNSQVSPDMYAMLEKEFGSNRTITGKERDNIREKISLGKKESITIDGGKREEETAKEEVIIKSNIISVKEEIPQPKILGKIDLDGGKRKAEPAKAETKPAPAPAPQKVEPKPAEPAKSRPAHPNSFSHTAMTETRSPSFSSTSARYASSTFLPAPQNLKPPSLSSFILWNTHSSP